MSECGCRWCRGEDLGPAPSLAALRTLGARCQELGRQIRDRRERAAALGRRTQGASARNERGALVPAKLARLNELLAEGAELEREADRLAWERIHLWEGRQVECYDWEHYASRGMPLPLERLALYEDAAAEAA